MKIGQLISILANAGHKATQIPYPLPKQGGLNQGQGYSVNPPKGPNSETKLR